MAWYFDCPGGDSLKIANPTGVVVNAAHTMLCVFRPITNAVDGRTLVRVGNASASTESRGFALAANHVELPWLRHPDAGFHEHASTLSMGTWYNGATHSAGSGSQQRGITIDGSKSTTNMGATTELSAGDEISIAYGLDAPGWAAPDVEIAMLAWLQGVDLSGADVEAYCNDPCSLIDDYGPDGAVTPDALKLLLLGDLVTDLSGVDNHPTIVGGEEVDGPTAYPTSCDVGGAAAPPVASALMTALSPSASGGSGGGGETGVAWEFDGPGGDSLKITNPVGMDVTGQFTMLTKARITGTGTDGNVIVKVGDPDDGRDTGLSLGYNGSRVPRIRIGAGFFDFGSAISEDVWYALAVHSFGSGVASRGISVDGVRESGNMDPPAALVAGDQFSVAYGDGPSGQAAPAVQIAMLAWLQGVNLTGAATLSYGNDPCSLIVDYGPTGAITPNALKLLVLGELTIDLSGVGNDPTIVDGLEVEGPADYPSACGTGGGALQVADATMEALSPTASGGGAQVVSAPVASALMTAKTPATGGTGSDPVWNWDPSDYANFDELVGDVSWVWPGGNGSGFVELVEGAVPWADGSKFVRTHFSGGVPGVSQSRGVDIVLGEAAQQRELWLQAYLRFDANWNLSGSNPDDKTLFLLQHKPGIAFEIHRWAIHLRPPFWGGANNYNPQMTYPFDYPEGQPDPGSEVWDGIWHRLRVHFYIPWDDDANGIFEWWWDDTLMHSQSGFATPGTPTDTVFSVLALGRNVDNGPDGTTFRDWGLVSAWTTSPDWGGEGSTPGGSQEVTPAVASELMVANTPSLTGGLQLASPGVASALMTAVTPFVGDTVTFALEFGGTEIPLIQTGSLRRRVRRHASKRMYNTSLRTLTTRAPYTEREFQSAPLPLATARTIRDAIRTGGEHVIRGYTVGALPTSFRVTACRMQYDDVLDSASLRIVGVDAP